MRVSESNLVELFEHSCERYEGRPFLGTRKNSGWDWLTYGQFRGMVDRCRAGLAALGVGPLDRVAIVADNRLEWAVACHATLGLCATFVPTYLAQREDERNFILADCGARVVFAATDAVCDSIARARARAELPAVEHVVALDRDENADDSFAALLRRGAQSPVEVHRATPETTAGLVYTSGTTGRPKGVVLTHGNVASDISALSEVFPLEPEDRSLSFLPWAHAYGQMAELHYLTSQGCSLALNDTLPRLLENLLEVRPTMLVAVPRVFNRIYNAVNDTVGHGPAVLRALFRDGIASATRRAQGGHLSVRERLELAADEQLIFRKVRERFGGRLKYVFSGSAALSPEVAHFVDALGIPVYEGYGLSETSPIVTANCPGHRKMGSVGRPLPGVRVTIDASVSPVPGQGEVVVYGPIVMRGYLGLPEETARAFTDDGGFRTGDLGYLDEDGYLFITGRLKDQFKLTNGRYVMPAPLEEHLELSPFIANALVHGANRPYTVALVVPDPTALAHWAEAEGVALGDPARDPRVRELLEREVAAQSRTFRGYEVPRRVLVAGERFTTENGLLTPTLKVKRARAEQRYRAELDALYAADAANAAEDVATR